MAACIDSDSDIAGIGVRVSIYTQAFLNLICMAVFVRDGHVSIEEGKVLEEVSKNLSLTTFAILLTAAIQSSSKGLSIYHALIVLNLCWINACSATAHAIMTMIMALHRFARSGGWDQEKDSPLYAVSQMYGIPSWTTSLVLAMVGYIGMGAFGLAVWKNVSTFGNAQQQGCTPHLFLPIFGQDIPVLVPSLRKGSLAVYSFVVIPFEMFFVFLLGTVIVKFAIVFITSMVSCCRRLCGYKIRRNVTTSHTDRAFVILAQLHAISAVIFMALIEVLFVVDTELMISRSVRAGLVADGEDIWSFGQTLAMVLVFMPLFQTVRAIWKLWNPRGVKPRAAIENRQEMAIQTEPGAMGIEEGLETSSSEVNEASSVKVKEV